MRATLGIAASGVSNRLWANSYLNNTGYVTTPDVSTWQLTTDVVITAKVLLRNPLASGVNQFLFCQWGTATADQAFLFWIDTTGSLYFQIRDPTYAARNLQLLTAAELSGWAGATMGIGVKAERSCRFVALINLSSDLTPTTGNWGETGTAKTGTSYTSTLNSAVPLAVGARSINGTELWGGRVYWAQMHTGANHTGITPTGAPLVRFDPNEHVVGTTSWTDPRGRAWSVNAESAIVHA